MLFFKTHLFLCTIVSSSSSSSSDVRFVCMYVCVMHTCVCSGGFGMKSLEYNFFGICALITRFQCVPVVVGSGEIPMTSLISRPTEI
jgi:hypothetical protein